MKDDELFKIPEEALRKIKTHKEFDDYFQELYKQGIQAFLKAEIRLQTGILKHLTIYW